jgi:hypothetical protein
MRYCGPEACYRCATAEAWCAEKWNEVAALAVGTRGLKRLDRTIQLRAVDWWHLVSARSLSSVARESPAKAAPRSCRPASWRRCTYLAAVVGAMTGSRAGRDVDITANCAIAPVGRCARAAHVTERKAAVSARSRIRVERKDVSGGRCLRRAPGYIDGHRTSW